jgi:hypothetical protein
MLPKGMIDVANIGIHPSNPPEVNTAAAHAAQQALPPYTSQRWFFGAADSEHPYRFADTFHVIRPIWLEGVGGGSNLPATFLQFPPGKHGLYFHAGDPNPDDEANNGAAVNLRIQGGGITEIGEDGGIKRTHVAHGVILKTTAILSYLDIEGFRGDGVHILASGNLTPKSNANTFRVHSVQVANMGDSIDVKVANRATLMERTGRDITVTTDGAHNLQIDDLVWLESDTPDPNFPRSPCGVTQVIDAEKFVCLHDLELTGNATASGSYRIIVGHGIYTHGDDANVGNVSACLFQNNKGWAVLEDSFLGNAYWGCHADNNGLGPYRAIKATGYANSFVSCNSETGPKPSIIEWPAIVIGGNHGAGVEGSGLAIRLGNYSTQLAFLTGSDVNGHIRLGSHGPGSTRYVAFRNVIDGPSYELTIDFDQADYYKQMLGFGQLCEHGHDTRRPAFLISGKSSVLERSIPGQWPMAVDAGRLFVNKGFWLGESRHETVTREPDYITHFDQTWNRGDRAWNSDVVPGGPEGWICVTGGTIGSTGTGGAYMGGRTATTDGTKAVLLDGATDDFKLGMYLEINGVRRRIVNKVGNVLTMDDVVPADGPGLTIAFARPVFRPFGTIS